jgi:nicotinamide mononucleotide adenylyltransferase
VTLGCVTGRFQPVHDQHLELFAHVLARCAHLVVAVTNPDTGARHEEATSAHRHTAEANPFTYFERVRLLTAALDGAAMRATIVPFDLTRPHVWHQYVPGYARQFVRAYSTWERQKAELLAAHYAVTVLDGDLGTRISASEVRRDLAEGRFGGVPAGAVPVLDELLAARPLHERG